MADDLPPEQEDYAPPDFDVFEERQLDSDGEAGEHDPPEDEPHAVSVSYVAMDIRQPAAYIIRQLAALEAYPVASATPAERADLLDLREALIDLSNAVRIRLGAIEMAFKRGMEELNAKELPVAGWGPVRYVPDAGSWEVHADSLRADLAALKVYGLIDDDDLDRAFKVVVMTTADNRVLNGLEKRGDAVRAAIEKNRTRREGREMGGKLTMPHRRGTKSEEA
jgi:hypothetical protein